MDISIIIVNYRSWNALDECLESINKVISQTFSFEVIVVDNNSDDGCLEGFREKHSKFSFFENSGNNGFSNGCNLGANEAEGRHLLFLNPDTRVTLNSLETILQTYVSNPEIGVLSCLQDDENGDYYNQDKLFPAFSRFFGTSRSLYRKLNKKKLNIRFNHDSDLFYPDWVSGAVFLVSRNWFNKVNGWNENYWLYFEDVDFCKKISEVKGKIAVTRNATVYHKHGGASRLNIKTEALTKTEVLISKHVYVSNHFPKVEKIILHSLLIFSTLFGKLLLSFLSLTFFFIPKLKVNVLIFKNISIYYFNAIKKQTWISPRSMNYLQ